MSFTFYCTNPNCRQGIEADEAMLGKSVPCPACATELLVPLSPTIEFTCSNPDCEQSITVDVAEAGRFVRCPACSKPLRIPGGAPEPAASRQTAAAKPVEKIAPKPEKPVATLRSRLAPYRRLALGWSVGAALCFIIILGLQVRSWATLPRNLPAIADEVFLRGGLRGAPVEDSAGRGLFYVRDIIGGAEIFHVDLTTLKRTLVKRLMFGSKKEDFVWLDWSPDRNSMAFFVKLDDTQQQVMVCDARTGKLKHSFDLNISRVLEGTWLSRDALVVSTASKAMFLLNLKNNSQLGPSGKQGVVKLPSPEKSDPTSLVRESDHVFAFIDNGNIWTMDIPSGGAKQLTHLNKAAPRELDYSPLTEKYMFVLDGNVYAYGPRSSQHATLTRLVDTNCFNGRWIQSGRGAAFKVRAGLVEHLGIQSVDASTCTNLFFQGKLQAFSVGADGETIYAVATDTHGIWRIHEYRIGSRSLREIIPPEESKVYARKVAPVEGQVTNSLGRVVDYYWMPPAGMDPKKKYPVVVDQNSANPYDQIGAFIANAGIFYVSPNKLGVTRWSAMPVYEDTLAVYDELLKNPNVDPSRIYVSGHSISTIMASIHVSSRPELWRGGLFLSPAVLPSFLAETRDFPSVFVTIGTVDAADFHKRCEDLFEDGCRRRFPARMDYQIAGHIYNPQHLDKSYQAAVKFIQSDY